MHVVAQLARLLVIIGLYRFNTFIDVYIVLYTLECILLYKRYLENKPNPNVTISLLFEDK